MIRRCPTLTAVFLLSLTATLFMQAQSPSVAILAAPDAGRILPPSVFFRGQSAPIQARNSAGLRFADGMLLLTALVDTSGYSTAVQQKYQAYLIAETAIQIDGQLLLPGAYGVGFVDGKFGVFDIGSHPLFSVESTHDAELKRPTPLQIVADPTLGSYRLYEGRDFVRIARSGATK